jgi:hypothetical protein
MFWIYLIAAFALGGATVCGLVLWAIKEEMDFHKLN